MTVTTEQATTKPKTRRLPKGYHERRVLRELAERAANDTDYNYLVDPPEEQTASAALWAAIRKLEAMNRIGYDHVNFGTKLATLDGEPVGDE